MDPAIAKLYNQAVLDIAMERFNIQKGTIRLLDGFESFIYEFYRTDGDYILRIGHSHRRSQELILGEVDWINFLSAGGAGVARAISSANHRLVEFIPDGQDGQFMATAFVKAKGGPPNADLWNKNLFQSWGSLLGRIHALTKNYMPSDPAWVREEWDSPGNMQVETWLPPEDQLVLSRFHALMEHLNALSKDQDCYGLIHQDAHAGNFYVDEDYNITLFDFDDCVYSWFIYDIAMVFFYGLMGHDDDPIHVRDFAHHFIEGYGQENALAPKWSAEIPFFLKLREIDLYAQIIFSFDGIQNVDDPWCQSYLKGRKERIEGDIPFIRFDWESLAEFL